MFRDTKNDFINFKNFKWDSHGIGKNEGVLNSTNLYLWGCLIYLENPLIIENSNNRNNSNHRINSNNRNIT